MRVAKVARRGNLPPRADSCQFMKRRFQRPSDDETADANMLPVMNIMFLLIPALLLSMEVASMAAISVSPPQFRADPGKAQSEPSTELALRVRIQSEGFAIELGGGKDRPHDEIAGPSIPSGDFAALQARAALLRESGELARIEISAEGDIPMQTLVHTIDAVQDREQPLPLVVSSS